MEQSTKAYEPGTVAVATVRGVEGVRIVRGDGHWAVATDTDDFYTDRAGEVLITDVRPLVVLDPENASVREFVRRHRDGTGNPACIYSIPIIEAIEAQTKPPRIPEPEWGEKVIAHTSDTALRRLFVNAYTGCEVGTTWTDRDGYHASWIDLIDPEAVQS